MYIHIYTSVNHFDHLKCRDIVLICRDLNHTRLFDGEIGLFGGDIGLFGGDIGLFCGDIGLFCGDIGLFGGDIGLFCEDVEQPRMFTHLSTRHAVSIFSFLTLNLA